MHPPKTQTKANQDGFRESKQQLLCVNHTARFSFNFSCVACAPSRHPSPLGAFREPFPPHQAPCWTVYVGICRGPKNLYCHVPPPPPPKGLPRFRSSAVGTGPAEAHPRTRPSATRPLPPAARSRYAKGFFLDPGPGYLHLVSRRSEVSTCGRGLGPRLPQKFSFPSPNHQLGFPKVSATFALPKGCAQKDTPTCSAHWDPSGCCPRQGHEPKTCWLWTKQGSVQKRPIGALKRACAFWGKNMYFCVFPLKQI